MRKLAALALAMTLVCLTVCGLPASAEATPLVSWEGYSVQLLNYKIYKAPGSSANLYLYARIVNGTDRELSLWFNEATVDGVPVVVVPILGVKPHTDTGVNDPEDFYVFAAKENKDAASDAISAARQLRGTLLLREAGGDEALLSQPVVIDLEALEGVRIINTPLPTATPTPRPTPESTPTPASSGSRATAPAYTPASYDFQTLKRGSRGQAVKDLQQRLTDLGFLNDRVDGSFGQNTATAVMSFCTQHGLYIQGDATPEMQRLLYSSSAEYYVEPYIPLVIGPRYKWDNPTNARQDIGWFYVQLVNRCSDRTIRGYELYYYQTDMWGEKITVGGNNAWLYPLQTQQTIKPGYIEYSKGFAVQPFAYTYSVWVGVHKIVFADGEIREIDPNDVQYFECPVKK